MVYIPNYNKNEIARKLKENNALEEKKRKKDNNDRFIAWQKENPGKTLKDYLFNQ